VPSCRAEVAGILRKPDLHPSAPVELRARSFGTKVPPDDLRLGVFAGEEWPGYNLNLSCKKDERTRAPNRDSWTSASRVDVARLRDRQRRTI
jgi:hypothetical protein